MGLVYILSILRSPSFCRGTTQTLIVSKLIQLASELLLLGKTVGADEAQTRFGL